MCQCQKNKIKSKTIVKLLLLLVRFKWHQCMSRLSQGNSLIMHRWSSVYIAGRFLQVRNPPKQINAPVPPHKVTDPALTQQVVKEGKDRYLSQQVCVYVHSTSFPPPPPPIISISSAVGNCRWQWEIKLSRLKTQSNQRLYSVGLK